ncbi:MULTISPECIES: hypothetical protein [Gammaproteobacteria]|uniref:hypothetical protein n=1 Tax=Gammaproteobacteria TaxID=1236 RepID=UPI000DD030B5|nr:MULTISPECIES: hypothetical protein [Gammaproteobacteria]RTE85474.1 hypothetical protein DQX04_11250 [Aliidiomarina sp. B3213]TCZ89441.1 hypothetical protein EYQ95_11170 [Lysobacter sp. N42]
MLIKFVGMGVLSLALFTGCAITTFKVGERNTQTGYFESRGEATILISAPADLDQLRSLVVVKNLELLRSQTLNINYFDEVMTIGELEQEIIRNGLAEQVPSVRRANGLAAAANYYREFLVLDLVLKRYEGAEHNSMQISLFDPMTTEYLFAAKTDIVYGLVDQAHIYPLYNALIDYIEDNSKDYNRFQALYAY